MSIRCPRLTDRQLAAREQIVTGPLSGEFEALRDELRPVAPEVWLPAAALPVAAALIVTIVEGQECPWELDETVWEQFLPEWLPSGRSEWRNANYALQAAGCLAAGVWLDVGRQESFWHLPLWPFTIDLVECLTKVAQIRLEISSGDMAAGVAHLLGMSAPVR